MNGTTREKRSAEGREKYFDDISAELSELERERSELKLQKEALKQLGSQVAKIDCDIGGASLEITDDGVIHVTTGTPDLCDEVKQLVHGYCWPKEFKIGYEPKSQCVTWSLKTDIETLTDDYHKQLTE